MGSWQRVMVALASLTAATAATAADPSFGRRRQSAGEQMIERAQADRAVLEQAARSGAARSAADAQARCARWVQKRLAEGRHEAAKRRLESCRQRWGSADPLLNRARLP